MSLSLTMRLSLLKEQHILTQRGIPNFEGRQPARPLKLLMTVAHEQSEKVLKRASRWQNALWQQMSTAVGIL